MHGKLPTQAELTAYKTKLKALRGLPANVKAALECAAGRRAPDGRDAHRRVGARLACCPRRTTTTSPGARDIADRLMASLGSMLLYWYHYSHNGKRIEVETDDDSIGGHFLHLLHGVKPSKSWVDAMHISLNLYAEHEFNASTFTGRVIAGTGSRHLLGDHRRDRRAARPEARRRQRSRVRDPVALPDARTKPKPTSAAASRTRKS